MHAEVFRKKYEVFISPLVIRCVQFIGISLRFVLLFFFLVRFGSSVSLCSCLSKVNVMTAMLLTFFIISKRMDKIHITVMCFYLLPF